jgi:type III restriction enzyme
MADIAAVHIKVSKRSLVIKESGIEGGQITRADNPEVGDKQSLPNLLAFLQRETKLTRKTLVSIIKKSGKIKDFMVNPALFMTEVAKCINRAMHELIIDGIKYEPISGKSYDMRLFDHKEVQSYLDRLYKVTKAGTRTPYDFIEYQSGIEKKFAEFLDANESVRFFCKLPSWFKVDTPLGSYNPDWAVVIENDEKLYLVRETKSTLDSEKRRALENEKLDCGKAHFEALDVNFKVVTDIHEIL